MVGFIETLSAEISEETPWLLRNVCDDQAARTGATYKFVYGGLYDSGFHI
jgi:hypothetical protein